MSYWRYTPGLNDASKEQRQLVSELPFFSYMDNFIGTKEEITETIRYYIEKRGFDLELPKEHTFLPLEKIMADCYFPGLSPKHTLHLVFSDDIALRVNANRFHDIHTQVLCYKNKRRGKLSKFIPNNNTIFYLPEQVMQTMAAYDWTSHEQQVKEWNNELDFALGNLKENSCFELEAKVREHGADGIIVDEHGVAIVKKKRDFH